MVATMNPAKNSNTHYCYYYNTLCVTVKRWLTHLDSNQELAD